jgi:hypothetical protein
MQELGNYDKKIITATIALIILVFALSFITPVISKKPDKVTKPSNAEAIDGGAGIEIFWDSKCTNRVSSIDWGSLEPGTDKTVTLFIKNKGKNQVTLSYHVSNWKTNEIANYLNIIWDYNGQRIGFKEVFQVRFTLYASENAATTENFSFDITIVGT